jgi:hypothetical protein
MSLGLARIARGTRPLSGGLADGGGYLSFVFSGLSDRKTRKISFRHWTERRFRGHH